MQSVLVMGRIRHDHEARLDAALAEGDLGLRVFRQGETLALLIDAPQVERHFLRLLRDERFLQVLACLEDVPLLPREVSAAA